MSKSLAFRHTSKMKNEVAWLPCVVHLSSMLHIALKLLRRDFSKQMSPFVFLKHARHCALVEVQRLMSTLHVVELPS